LPNPTDYFAEKPPTGSINLNGKTLTNVGLVDLTATGILSSAVSIATSSLLHPNTSILNLTDSASYGNKRLTNMGDANLILGTDSSLETIAKL
jgi:hypothetical protein